jgi:hypothetical protein
MGILGPAYDSFTPHLSRSETVPTPPTDPVLGGHLSPQVAGPQNHRSIDDPSVTPHLTEISLDEVYRCLLRDPSSRQHAFPPRTR